MKEKRIVFKDDKLIEEEFDWDEIEKIKKEEENEEGIILKRINEIVLELENIKKMLKGERMEEKMDNVVVDEKTKSLNELLNKMKEKGYEVNGIYE